MQALAAAPLDGVLKAWEGLGYYARARNLHRAAQAIVERHGGVFPCDPQAVRALPGVGEYTAGAILSIAFGQDEPALDGNLRRVLSRLFYVAGPPEAGVTLDALRRLAREVLPAGQAGPFNQALMDLGATICTPRRPRCMLCPVLRHCEARRRGAQEEVPARKQRRQAPHYEVTAALIWRDGRVLIAQRPAEGLLGGLWEFPGGKQEPGESLPACLQREIREELALEIEVGEPLISVGHGYTHFSITLHAFHARPLPGQGEPRAVQCADWRWVRPEELDRYAFSAADRKVIAALRADQTLEVFETSEV